MAWHGVLTKTAPTVVIGVVGVTAYKALGTVVAKVPLREATVTATAWGLRVVGMAERPVADVIAEVRERIGKNSTGGGGALRPRP
uniref:DUF1490 domain-containing protein n=1 Tax=Mycobacterium riyadhense TaxID=486698 RepID=A0A653F2C3_9MYCO|nr:hypothetical protein BIN_B_05306 [Mycobacterium riyadhense]